MLATAKRNLFFESLTMIHENSELLAQNPIYTNISLAKTKSTVYSIFH